MFNGAYTFGTGFLWKLSINSFPALVCCHIHVHSTFCEWDNITLDFSNLSANLVKQRNLTFFPFNPTTTFNNAEQFQLVHYGPGTEYKPHFDAFDKTIFLNK